MKRRRFRLGTVLSFAALLMLFSALAHAQGGLGATTIAGSIVDTSGGVIPGADVVAKNNATASELRGVSDSTGHFTISAVPPGTYTVTISMMGFKTVVLPDIVVLPATPATVKPVMLEVGQLTETVTVTGATEIVQTQSATVTSTLNTQQINRTPLVTRNTLDFVAMLPGVSSASSSGGPRYSSVMGLPGSSLNITIDGLNTQDQSLKGSTGSSFFSNINPRMDAVEEVTVSTANPGAESSGQGAVQIRFQTRSGTNKFQGSGYEYMRRTQWNTPYWFNEHQTLTPTDADRVDTFGGRFGGPIVHDKAFFFFNYEEFRQPASVTRSRTVLTADSLAGIFDYTVNGVTQKVNLFQLAAANGQTSTADPSLMAMLNGINATLTAPTATVSAGSNSVTQTLSFVNTAKQRRVYPTMRGDINVTTNNRVGVSFYIQRYTSTPDFLNSRDPAFPGYALYGTQVSWRPALMGNWRSVLGPNVVNEVRMGYTGWPLVHFSDNVVVNDTTFPGGYHLSLPLVNVPYMYGNAGNWEARGSSVLNIEDSMNWIRGKHQFTFGGAFTQIKYDDKYQYYAPYVGIGFDTNANTDPAASMFSTTTFPGINSTDLSNARSLYALLTGRITSLNNSAFINSSTGQYQFMGPWEYLVKQNEWGFYAQDSWKVTPSLTLNGGLRYELQMPFTSQNAMYSQLTNYSMLYGMGQDGSGNPVYFYNPSGTASVGSSAVTVSELMPGQAPFSTDKNNLAPSFGAAWRAPVKSGGWLSKILSNDPVFRAGYSRSYIREGMSTTSDIFGANPGGSIVVQRNDSLGNLINDSVGYPLLYSQTSRLAPPAFASAPAYPLAPSFANSINAFYPSTQTPWVHSFNFSFQRSLTKDTALDIRYVGTRARGSWVDGGRNINELNVLENGFAQEFKNAQQNYLINENTYGWNTTAGNSFAYKGLPGQSALPIMQGFFSGLAPSLATDSTKYTSSAYTNTTFLGYLVPTNPNVTSFGSSLFTTATYRANGLTAGYPADFFYMNPAISGGAYVTGRPEDSLSSNFDAIQIELRRRMNNGLLIQGSYQYIIRENSTQFLSVRIPAVMRNYASGFGNGDPVHNFKLNWTYELPFGQGKKWGSNVSRGMNRLVGGWSFDGVARIQTGQVLDFGNVLLVGMTDADLQKMYKEYLYPDATNPAITRVYMLPQDVIQNTILAYSTSYAAPNGYANSAAPTGRYFAPIQSNGCLQVYAGACAVNGQIVPASTPIHHYVTGPTYTRFDMSLSKRLDITSRVWGEIRLDVLNVFNNVDFFGTTSLGGTTVLNYQVSSGYRDFNNTQDPGGRLLQVSYRVSF